MTGIRTRHGFPESVAATDVRAPARAGDRSRA